MVAKDNKDYIRFNWRRLTVFGILLILTMVQGSPPSLNPVTLAQGNTIGETSLINTYATRRSPVDAPGTIQWHQTYGGMEGSEAFTVIQTADGGFALAGERNQDCWLVKTDAHGTMQWDSIYVDPDQSYSAEVHSVIQTTDGGFVFVGDRYYMAGDETLRRDCWLVKTDTNGTMLWNRSYGYFSDYYLELWQRSSVIQTADGGFAVIGPQDAWLAKTDAQGDILWERTYGDAETCSVIQTTDGGFALAGYTSSYGAGFDDFWLVKTDASGIVEWSQTFGGSSSEILYSVIQTADGGYALVGHTMSYGAGDYDFWLVKTDSRGVTQWSHTYGGANEEYAQVVIETTDGGFVLAGYTSSYGAGERDLWLVKTDTSGIVEWSQTFGGSEDDCAQAVIETTDGGFALTGYTSSYGGRDFWLVKTVPTSGIDGSFTLTFSDGAPMQVTPWARRVSPIPVVTGLVRVSNISSTQIRYEFEDWPENPDDYNDLVVLATILSTSSDTPRFQFLIESGATNFDINFLVDILFSEQIGAITYKYSDGTEETDRSPTSPVAKQLYLQAAAKMGQFVEITLHPPYEDGSGLTQLTDNAASDWRPSISDDGSRIAFNSYRTDDDEIFVVNADGTDLTQLTDNAASDYITSISGDGSKIVFYSENWYSDIFVVNTDGTDLTPLTNYSMYSMDPSISGNGFKIAFSSYRDRDDEIFIVNADGSDLIQLTDNTADDEWPSISGDGSKIAFQSDIDGDCEIFVMNADGSGLTQLTDNTADDWGPSFSGDGSKIAFLSEMEGYGDAEIFVVNADGSGLTQLTFNTVRDRSPVISGDGSKIAFVSLVDGDGEIFVVNADGSGLTRLTNNTARDGEPSISGDGSRIVFSSNVDGNWEIYLWRAEKAGVPPSDTFDNSWTPRTPMPTPREDLAAVVVNEKIYAIGGYNGTHNLATVEEYDPTTDTWRPRAPMPTARGWLAATVVAGKIYAVGGWDGEKYLPTVEVYDPTTDSWTPRADMPTHRYGLAVVAVGDRIYAIGGQNEMGYRTTVEEYDPATNTWRRRADMATRRYGLAAGVVRGRIYALGGLNEIDGALATVEEYNPILNTWHQVADMPTAQISLAAATVGGRLYAIGGLEPYPSPVEEYDPLTYTWMNRSPLPTTRTGLAAVVVRGRIYVIGGYDGNRRLGTVEEYNPPFFDTDDDGFADDEELRYGRDPLVPESPTTDTDGDGLTDMEEITTYSTNPWVPDADADTDADGLRNVEEVDTYDTSVTIADTDGDGLLDGVEVTVYGTNPTLADTDGDSLLDKEEVTRYHTNPSVSDADADTDGDGLMNVEEVNTHNTNPLNNDTDGDELTDGEEVNTYGTDPKEDDTDGDELTDGEEVNTYGTNPSQKDSDGDGLEDGFEIRQGTDPLNRDTDRDLFRLIIILSGLGIVFALIMTRRKWWPKLSGPTTKLGLQISGPGSAHVGEGSVLTCTSGEPLMLRGEVFAAGELDLVDFTTSLELPQGVQANLPKMINRLEREPEVFTIQLLSRVVGVHRIGLHFNWRNPITLKERTKYIKFSLKVEPEAVMDCPYCGESISKSERFCPHCYAEL